MGYYGEIIEIEKKNLNKYLCIVFKVRVGVRVRRVGGSCFWEAGDIGGGVN